MIRILLAALLLCASSCFAGQGMGPGPGVKGYATGLTLLVGVPLSTDLATYTTNEALNGTTTAYSCFTAAASGTAVKGFARVKPVRDGTNQYRMHIYRQSDGVRLDSSNTITQTSAQNVETTEEVAFSGGVAITQGVGYCVAITGTDYWGAMRTATGTLWGRDLTSVWNTPLDTINSGTPANTRTGQLGVRITN